MELEQEFDGKWKIERVDTVRQYYSTVRKALGAPVGFRALRSSKPWRRCASSPLQRDRHRPRAACFYVQIVDSLYLELVIPSSQKGHT